MSQPTTYGPTVMKRLQAVEEHVVRLDTAMEALGRIVAELLERSPDAGAIKAKIRSSYVSDLPVTGHA